MVFHQNWNSFCIGCLKFDLNLHADFWGKFVSQSQKVATLHWILQRNSDWKGKLIFFVTNYKIACVSTIVYAIYIFFFHKSCYPLTCIKHHITEEDFNCHHFIIQGLCFQKVWYLEILIFRPKMCAKTAKIDLSV